MTAGPRPPDLGVRFSTVARVGVALALLLPYLSFAAAYAWHHHTSNGLSGELAVATAYGLLDTVTAALAHPMHTLVYCAVLAALTRFAFGAPPRSGSPRRDRMRRR